MLGCPALSVPAPAVSTLNSLSTASSSGRCQPHFEHFLPFSMPVSLQPNVRHDVVILPETESVVNPPYIVKAFDIFDPCASIGQKPTEVLRRVTRLSAEDNKDDIQR
jgi:hypothetical protein